MAIADAGSVHRAAQQLGMPQPALSRQLAEAERLLEVRLFDRSSHGMAPTSAGKAVLPRCQLLLRLLGGIRNIGQQRRPQILLGCVQRSMQTMMPIVLGRWQPLHEPLGTREEPLLRVLEGDSLSLWHLLLDGKLDFAVLREQPQARANPQALLVQHLYDDHTAIICAGDHPVLRSGEVPLERLPDFGWALPQVGRTSRAILDRMLADRGCAPIQPVIEARSFESLIDVVASTRLLSIAPAMVVQKYVKAGKLRTIAVRPALPATPISLACHPEILEDPWMETFRSELHQAGVRLRQAARSRRAAPSQAVRG
ncbi:MAG: LysR family transcriptional regulator [Burkholderiales bacterium]|nr:LysR family transcriptional regulator [Burkholderiales bacterium]MDE1927148.1 LysR family transcriptional regulator [Burkholderiales bacterium]MDE2157956.1 LysR family transcriptional regulator [Burkholderiales bacterium]